LKKWGLQYIFSPAAAAHPFENGNAVLLKPSVEATAEQFEKR